ncbi:virion structural protein [Arthrobacter phage KellEzio]|uniref:Capsid maturation protease n=1 Tax=Arthrobacter phage KellEzio TaxID=1796995 RepID=A0A140G6A1_9CAUD|nr:virion structural protein [Arthrobacter phage KellEzio]AMM44186.1 capsid maturation protease [Arthrobacter phage KellEzio]
MALVLRQARAVVDNRTTMVCLHISGAITSTDLPFETLAGDFMDPPFHIHCRTIVGPWMPGMVNDLAEEANAEMQRRPKAQRRIGPNGEIGGSVPPPSTGNSPSGFSFPGAKKSKYDKPPAPFVPDEDEYEETVAALQKGQLTKDNAGEYGMFAALIVDGLGTWTQGQEGMDKLRGGKMPDQLNAMEAALAEAPKAPTLYRGMFWSDSAEKERLIGVQPGDVIAPRTAFSFTTARVIANEYTAWIEDEDDEDEEIQMGVIYRLEGGNGIDMKNFTRDFASDQEWLVGHELVVKTVTQIGAQLWEIVVGR